MNMKQSLFLAVLLGYYLVITIDSTRPPECELPKVVGRCRAAIPSYYFNTVSEKCEYFAYGGCDGNENRFHKEDECIQRCENTNNNRNG